MRKSVGILAKMRVFIKKLLIPYQKSLGKTEKKTDLKMPVFSVLRNLAKNAKFRRKWLTVKPDAQIACGQEKSKGHSVTIKNGLQLNPMLQMSRLNIGDF